MLAGAAVFAAAPDEKSSVGIGFLGVMVVAGPPQGWSPLILLPLSSAFFSATRDILQRHPGAPVIFDVKCSQRLPVAIREAGGVPLLWKTGHSLIKAKLKETGAPFAGEMSGHIFFGERWYGFDDATYTAARLLEILSRSADPSAVTLCWAPGSDAITPADALAYDIYEAARLLLRAGGGRCLVVRFLAWSHVTPGPFQKIPRPVRAVVLPPIIGSRAANNSGRQTRTQQILPRRIWTIRPMFC